MKAFCDALDNLPLIVKIILALPALDIIWGIYRVLKSADKKNTVGIILGILFIILGFLPVAIFDIIYLLIYQKSVWWID